MSEENATGAKFVSGCQDDAKVKSKSPQSTSLFMQTWWWTRRQWDLNKSSFLEEFVLLLEGKSIKKIEPHYKK